MMEKITKREMYEAIAEAMKTGECRYDPAEVISFCENEIDLLDKKAAKAKERAAAKAAEGDTLTALVRAALATDEFKSIADVTAIVAEEEPDATAARVSYRLTRLVENGEAVKEQITVPGSESQKARKLMAYKLI